MDELLSWRAWTIFLIKTLLFNPTTPTTVQMGLRMTLQACLKRRQRQRGFIRKYLRKSLSAFVRNDVPVSEWISYPPSKRQYVGSNPTRNTNMKMNFLVQECN